MPCWEVRTNQVDFGKAQGHEDILADALTELGYTAQRSGGVIRFQGHGVSGSYSSGRFTTQGDTFDVDSVKRAFGGQVVKKAAKQFGWRCKQTGPSRYQIIKGQ